MSAILGILLVASAVAPESPEVGLRFRSCVDGVREAGLEPCRAALAQTSLSSRHRVLALTLLAQRLADLQRWEEALAAQRELVALQPGDGLAKLRLGELLLYAFGRPEEAAEILESAVELRGADPAARASLGMALNALSRFPESVAIFEGVRDPAFFDTHPGAREAFAASRKGERWPATLALPAGGVEERAVLPSPRPKPRVNRSS